MTDEAKNGSTDGDAVECDWKILMIVMCADVPYFFNCIDSL